MHTQIDHLVIVASTLEQGVQWCEDTLGITPSPGGEHTLYGTHNRLFKIASPANPLAYGEIIAINPAAVRPKRACPTRWYDMDNPALQKAVAKVPRLVHFVVNTPDIKAARMAVRMQGIDRGPAISASRRTNRGTLNWQISVRADGQRLFDGCMPSLIQWGKPEATDPFKLHPRNTLTRSGVTLQSLEVTHPSAAKLQAAYDAMELARVTVTEGPANLKATLQTPKGVVVLESLGL
ncbi:VOC family protein [Limnohabitans sp.]|uniref:VOC family protein n=1 Tax=Limnohabitans sp. TaxID=1907725 RepID=UPI00286F2183|nr:VOC family protein [Limnohabitans sp.]